MKNYTTRLSEEEAALVTSYSQMYHISISSLLRELLLTRIHADLLADDETLRGLREEVTETLSHKDVWDKMGVY